MQIICKTTYYRLIMIAICIIQVAIINIYGQRTVDCGIGASYQFTLSPRWKAAVEGEVFRQFDDRASAWGRLALNGRFTVTEKRNIFMSASMVRQIYTDVSNYDTELRLTEGFNIQTQSGLAHNFYLTQRRIIYQPTNDKAMCSDISYNQHYAFPTIGQRLTPFADISATANITPDISNAPVLQRFRVGGGLIFDIKETLRINATYRYSMGSKRQIFIGDAHGMNYISLTLSIK